MLIQKKNRKYAFQVATEMFFVFSYIWIVEIYASKWWINAAFLWGLCVAFPIVCIARDQRRFPEFSLDWNHFKRCLRILVWFTLSATVFMVLLSLFLKTFNYDGQLLKRISEYIFWAFLQQIGIQTFLTYRVGKVIDQPKMAALVSASIFALFHFPNPVLMAFTWVSGYFWALSYLEAPNLYAIAISHGWLAVIALHSVPRAWLHSLRVGPTYWSY